MSCIEEEVTCPYNPVHKLRPHKMVPHIIRCSKNYPNVNLVACTHNATHRVRADQIEEHERECIDRSKLERQVFQSGPRPESIDNLIPNNLPMCTEDWDSVDAPPSYLTVKDKRNREQPLLLMGETCVGKAARKNYLRSEHQRHTELQNQKGNQ